MAKRFSGNGLALDATRFSSSALTAIADNAIAAPPAVSMPAASSADAPIDVTNRATRVGAIIAITSGPIAAVAGKRNKA